MENNTKKEYSLEEILKSSGYEQEHIDFCSMVLEILRNSGKHFGHTTVAEMVNVLHYAHLMTLVHNGVIPLEDEENFETPTVMKYSAMFAENIMNTVKAYKKEKENET